MNSLRTVWTTVLLAMVSIITGCAGNKQYRTSYKPYDLTDPDHIKAVIESTSTYKMGVVEFDDQGWYWDPKQCDAVEQMVRNAAGVGDEAHSTPQGIVLVVFVHGWKDNADFNSFGVQAFRDILQELSKLEQTAQIKKIRSARKVIGVYAGWRGLSATWEPFKELSFWDRKETAHKVGGYGAMTKLLVDLEAIQKKNLSLLPKEAPRTELIIIGHSLGAAAVYSALSQIITERFINTVENTKNPTPLRPLGDQIIFSTPPLKHSAIMICICWRTMSRHTPRTSAPSFPFSPRRPIGQPNIRFPSASFSQRSLKAIATANRKRRAWKQSAGMRRSLPII